MTVSLLFFLSFCTLLAHSQNDIDYYNQAVDFLSKNLLIDGHNDMTYIIRLNFENQFESFDLYDLLVYNLAATRNITQTDIKRIKKGLLSGQFWSVFSECHSMGKDAVRLGLEQVDAMIRIVSKYNTVFQLARNPQEILAAYYNGRVASLMGLEGGHMIDSSLAVLRMYYELGVRYMGLTHNCNVPWATNSFNDSTYSPSLIGLTEFGRTVVKEMNRLGMMIDLAHTSYQTQLDVLSTSQTPVLISHSSVYTLCNNVRNIRDDVLLKLKENKGIIMINFYVGFVNCNSASTPTNVQFIVDHLNYVKALIGVDYIGLGGNFDGVPRLPDELEDVSKYPNLFAALLQNGWTLDELVKISSGNILRVFTDNLNYAALNQAEPIDDIISAGNLDQSLYGECRTSF